MKKSSLVFPLFIIALAALLVTCQSGTERKSTDNQNGQIDTSKNKQPDSTKTNAENKSALADTTSFLIYHVNTKAQSIKLYWKDDKGEIIRSLGNLRRYLAAQNKTLVF